MSQKSPSPLEGGGSGRGALTSSPVMRSAAHKSHSDLGASFEVRGAWEVPASYGSETTETEAMRTGLAIADVSARGKLHLSGSIDALVRLMAGDAVDPLRTAAITSGGVVARVARDFALALFDPSAETDALTAVEGELTGDAMATDATSALSGYLVAGPLTKRLFARTVTVDVEEIQPGRCLAARWAHIPAILVISTAATPMVEVYVGSEYGRYAWRTLLEVGDKLGGIPVGWKSLEAAGWR
jgi:glycine cleavage system aminomethyltransferase T